MIVIEIISYERGEKWWNSEHIRGFWYKNMRGIRMEWGDFGIFLPPHRNEGIKDKGVLNSNNNPLSPDILSIV